MKLSRRNLIKYAGAIAATNSFEVSILAQTALNMATIPSSGQKVPQIGIGCRNYRGALNSDEMPVFEDTLTRFHRGGGKILDTSPNYGNSEEIIGQIMNSQGIREDLWIATKVDREGQASGIARMERSFELLGGDSFELMQVHNLRGTEIQLETMKEWKEQGRFRYIGVTTSNDRQYGSMEETMNAHQLDFVQLDYSLGNAFTNPFNCHQFFFCFLYRR